MKSKKSSKSLEITSLNLESRISLVMLECKKRGFISRQLLIEAYNLTPRDAGLLMREFIQENAIILEWDKINSNYRLTR